MQHSLSLCKFLPPAGVGALIERLRADVGIRPYGFLWGISANFCTPFLSRPCGAPSPRERVFAGDQ